MLARSIRALAVLSGAFLCVGCKCSSDKPKPGPAASASVTLSGAPSASAQLPTLPPSQGALSGSSIARTPDDAWLLIADEDNQALRVARLPLGSAPLVDLKLPGRPAQVVTDGERVWVTLRAPSLLWTGKFAAGTVSETARLELPADAWGIALSADFKQAVVSSAWSAQVSLIDLEKNALRWSAPVSREPRGVSIGADGSTAYVTHLVGSHVTRLELNGAANSEALDLPAAPLRSKGRKLAASLGYAGALSPDGRRFFAARHALGALGKNAWFGAATVDVLGLDPLAPVLAPQRGERPEYKTELAERLLSGGDTALIGQSLTLFTQPRALLYRKSTDTLLVAGEGDDRIVELDALAPDPTLAAIAQYPLASTYHGEVHVAAEGSAPTGMVLSRDETKLWVHCRGSSDLAEVELRKPGEPPASATVVKSRLDLGEDPLGKGGATGRKLFYSSTDHPVSGGLGCAGCHPEGRDDGYVWHEATFNNEDGETTNFVGISANIPAEAHTHGYARRTPMLAGRVNAEGPYGWHAESPTITDREVNGFTLHRWGAVPERSAELVQMRAKVLADFLRRGLVAPAPPTSAPSAAAERGRAIFLRGDVGCASCHAPDKGYTTREAFALPALPTPADFDADPNPRFKIPALSFLAQRAPYFHDGSAASLTDLVEHNGTRMGDTQQLSPAERRDLVAFLETL
ncbi:MAG: c-type cytochrome [Polyangiaceae bacterium]